MAHLRHDTLVACQLKRWYTLMALAGVLCLGLVVKGLNSGGFEDTWIPLLGLVPLLVVGYAGKYWILAGFKCRDCGARLPLPKRERGQTFAVRYHCPRCNIVWETGIKDSEDSGA